MPINKSRLYQTLSKGNQTQGVRIPAAAENAAIKIVESQVMGLWEAAAVAASKLATGKAVTRDSVADVGRVINQIYRDYSGLTALNKTLKARWDADNKYHRANFLADINRAVGINVSALLDNRGTEAVVHLRLAETMNYIKTLDSDLVNRLTKEVWAGIQRGDDALSIQKFIIEGAGADYPKWRARLIARDQTGKLFGQLSKVRQEDIGVEYYFWETVKDGAVRKEHAARDGVRYKWGELSEDEEPGMPIECRCIARADLSSVRALLGTPSSTPLSDVLKAREKP